MIGAELGYRYAGSPLVWPEAGEAPEHDFLNYVPTTWPGARLPHVWLVEGTRDAGPHRRRLHAAAPRPARRPMQRRCNGPLPHMPRRLQSSTSSEEHPRDIYGYDLVLLRPDLHVVWRGNSLDGPAKLAAIATGH